MRLTSPMALLSTTPRRVLAALLALIVLGVVATFTVTRVSALLSGTVSNSSNTYTASSCFLPVPVSMVNGNAFSPASLGIAAGCSVTWTNTTSTNHNTRSTSVPVVWSSSNLGLNGTFNQAFPTAGTYPYWCSIHKNSNPPMTGTITVT